MKKFYLALILLLVSIPAMAQQGYPRDITLSFNWPTQFVDLTLIQEGDLRGGDAICFRNQDPIPTFDVPINKTVLLGERETVPLIGVIPNPGTYHCFVTAVTVDGISSDLSNETIKRYTGKPLPVANLTIEVT